LVKPGTPAALVDRDPGWTGGPDFEGLSHKELEAEAKAVLARGVEELSEAQELLWASDTYALLIVFQAMDAAGKDSAIEHVMTGVNPQGVQVVGFRKPSAEELDHDFLWRISKALPERGRIGIFNRSHYEEVVALRVHPEWLEGQKLPPPTPEPALWNERYEDINAFERHLDRNGTKIVKFFLHVSKEEQKERFGRIRGRAQRHLDAVVRHSRRPQVAYPGARRQDLRGHDPGSRSWLARGNRGGEEGQPGGPKEARGGSLSAELRIS
jgi:Polyphosphate kinase 2 (PPK2)